MRHEDSTKHQLRLAAGSRVIRSDGVLEAARDQNRAVDKSIQQRPPLG